MEHILANAINGYLEKSELMLAGFHFYLPLICCAAIFKYLRNSVKLLSQKGVG